jgi:hypothetical protein
MYSVFHKSVPNEETLSVDIEIKKLSNELNNHFKVFQHLQKFAADGGLWKPN